MGHRTWGMRISREIRIPHVRGRLVGLEHMVDDPYFGPDTIVGVGSMTMSMTISGDNVADADAEWG